MLSPRTLLFTLGPSTALALLAARIPPEQPPAPHGTVVFPMSRVYRIYQANPQNPSFQLAANAVAIDGALSYYTWNEVSRNVPQAVQANLPPGFDYARWMPDGQLASAGRVDPNSTAYPRTYAGLDQVSADWPTTPVTAGETLNVSFRATAAHAPSVWDVWMTTPDWDASTALRWSHMEFLGRPGVTLTGTHYEFPLTVPTDRTGHHVLWIAWQRDDPAGEVFISTSDIEIRPANDECAGAVAVATGDNGPFELSGATPSREVASCEVGPAGPDVWFTYVPQCSGTLRAATCGPSASLDTRLSIWSGDCSALVEVGCDDDGCGLQSAATASVTRGTTYYIKVGAAGPAGSGAFDLAVSFANGTGSFTATTRGCGGATLHATGAPNLGGIVGYSISGAVGSTQRLLLGFAPASFTACSGCTLGLQSVDSLPAATSFLIPCDPSLIGASWLLQGVDAFGTTGGCDLGGGVDYTLTDTLRTVVGS